MPFKSEITKAIKTKYKSLGFSEKAIDAVATLLEGTTNEESEVDAAVEGVEPLLKAFQGDADKRVTDAVKKAQTEKTEDKEKEKEKEKTPPTNEEVPTWAQGLIKANETLLQEINALKAGKTTESRQATLEAMLKDTPEKFREMKLKDFARMSFKDDAEFDAYKTELETGLEGMKDVFAGAQGSEKLPIPGLGKPGKNGISADTQAYIEAKKAESQSQTTGKKVFETP